MTDFQDQKSLIFLSKEGVSKVTFWYALFQFLFHIVAWASPLTLVNASSFLWVRRIQRLHVPP